MKKNFLMSLVGLLVSLTAMAQLPTSGKYYRIVNQNPDKSITTSGVRTGFCITEDLISNALRATEQHGDSAYNQIWKYDGSKFQNTQTLRYIGSLYGSTQGYTSSTGSAVRFEAKGNNFLIKSSNGQYFHADGGNAIVGWWDTNNSSNWWNFEEVEVNEADMKAAQDLYKQQQEEKKALMAIIARADEIVPVVEGYFQDKACITLKSEFADLSDDAFKTRMTADNLPEQVQTMVLNIKNKWAGEYNPAMSERFRVQSYKVYSRCDDGGVERNAQGDTIWHNEIENGQTVKRPTYKPSPKTKWVSTQMSDRNNPTGIWTDALQLMFVFVEDEIPEGTSLKIAGASGSGVIGVFDRDGVELHRGMNILYSGLDYTTQWIMYTCAADYEKKMSDYPEIKIHIEGGNVLGYVRKHVSEDVYNTTDEAATNAEYAEILSNAMGLMTAKGKDMNKINFTVIGERGVFEFPVECYRQIWSNDSQWGAKIYKSLNFYDSVLKWEWSNMGWQCRVEEGVANNALENLAPGGGDAIWPTYVNCKAPTMMAENGKNPYSGNSHTGMPGIWAVESSYNAERADFDTWCCGHESGHNNQHTINLPSSMESSNNYFSDIITYEYGYRMSRGGSFDENIGYRQQNLIFSHRDIGMTHRMWYNMWLYYHLLGHNKQFSPKLHKLLRADRMSFGGEGWHNGSFGGANKGSAANSWLKFYEKACEAAGEDLTEYFRLWGFFIPTSKAGGSIEKIGDKYYAYCGDYSSYYVRCDQADIDAAIARVKAKGYPKNLQIMFMEDRQMPRDRHDPLAKPGDKKPYNSGWMGYTQQNLNDDFGYLGDVFTFGENAKPGNYTYICSANHINITGEGGVGFIFYDKEKTDSIVYLANKFKFDLPTSVAKNGFTLKVINADGTQTEVPDNAANAPAADKLAMLNTALELAATYTVLGDGTGKVLGMYDTEDIAPLKSIVTEAHNTINKADDSKYLELANKLNNEVIRLQEEVTTHQVKENTLYTINNVRDSQQYLSVSGNYAGYASSASAEGSKWLLIPTGNNDDTYYLQNGQSKQLLGCTPNEKGNLADRELITMGTEVPLATNVYKLKAQGGGKFSLRPMDKVDINLSPSFAPGIISWGGHDEGSEWVIREVETLEPVTDAMFNALITKSQDLLDDVCTLNIARTEIALQATDASAAGYVSTNEPGAENNPNPVANAVDGKTVTYFQSNTSNANSSAPHHLMIDLGKGKQTKNVQFELFSRATYNYAKNIFVYGSTNGNTWTKVGVINVSKTREMSPIMRGTTAFRYWRLDVMTTNQKTTDNNPYPYFGISELKMYTATESVELLPQFVEGKLSKTLASTLSRRLDEGEGQQGTCYRTVLSDNVAYDALVKAYDNLYAKASAIDPTVDIKGIEADEAEGDGAIYDLSGRKVNNMDKGIYIINGKKVLR